MGGRQESWLYDQMKSSKDRGAQWKLLGQQIVCKSLAGQVLSETPLTLCTVAHINTTDDVDAWDGYRANRRRVLDTINENQIDNVVILSGDSQWVTIKPSRSELMFQSANWVSDITYDNYTNYDASTGAGSFAVEFAGTGVSSPS